MNLLLSSYPLLLSCILHPSLIISQIKQHYLSQIRTCMIDALNLDRFHELNVIIWLEDWVNDVGYVSYGVSMLYLKLLVLCPLYLVMLDQTSNSDKLKDALHSVLMTCFLWKILFINNYFHLSAVVPLTSINWYELWWNLILVAT